MHTFDNLHAVKKNPQKLQEMLLYVMSNIHPMNPQDCYFILLQNFTY